MTDFARILLDSGKAEAARPIRCVAKEGLETALSRLGEHERAWAKAHGFAAQAGRTVVLPDPSGGVAGVLFGLGDAGRQVDPFLVGKLASELPEGTYAFAGDPPADPRLAALGWLLESYRFERYRSANGVAARLVTPQGVDRDEVLRSPRPSPWCATSSTRPPATWGRRSSKRPPGTLPGATGPAAGHPRR
jgi:leucyl aminopeptidase